MTPHDCATQGHIDDQQARWLSRQLRWLKAQCECETTADSDTPGLCIACGIAVCLERGNTQLVQTIAGEWVTARVCNDKTCDERRRSAQEQTWRRAAHLVNYYTGRDLDVLDDEYMKETGL